eukprot:scaffold2489_cov377-Pavlova_lutheri.AAC.1
MAMERPRRRPHPAPRPKGRPRTRSRGDGGFRAPQPESPTPEKKKERTKDGGAAPREAEEKRGGTDDFKKGGKHLLCATQLSSSIFATLLGNT